MRILVLLFLLLAPGFAFADGPVVGPRSCRMVWDQPRPSVDYSIVATGWHLYLATVSNTYTTAFMSVPAVTPVPDQVRTITVDCRTFALTDGQHYAVVSGYTDTTESLKSNEVPFSWNSNQAMPDPEAIIDFRKTQ